MSKPSVNDPSMEWILVDRATPLFWTERPPHVVEAYRQESEESILDHFRLKVDGKWIRKTFYGETAWMDVERYAHDHYSVDVCV